MSDEAIAESDVGRAATGLLGSLSLLFVPAGVGVVQYLDLLREDGVRWRSPSSSRHRRAAGDGRRLPPGQTELAS